MLAPQTEQFFAQIGRCEHIERTEWLVHEEQFGLDHQRAREADALAHAAGKLFRVGILETVQADCVDYIQ